MAQLQVDAKEEAAHLGTSQQQTSKTPNIEGSLVMLYSKTCNFQSLFWVIT